MTSLARGLDWLSDIADELESREEVSCLDLVDLQRAADVDASAAADGDGDAVAMLAINFDPAPTDEATTEADSSTRSDTESTTDPDADDPDDSENCWCGRCGAGPKTESGVRIHNGHVHDGDAVVLDDEPDEDELVGDISDDDGDAEPESESEPELEADGQPDESALDDEADAVEADADVVDEGGEPATTTADGGQVALPEGVSPDEVREIATDATYITDVTDEIRERTNADLTDERVRAVLMGLDCYGEIRDVRTRQGEGR